MSLIKFPPRHSSFLRFHLLDVSCGPRNLNAIRQHPCIVTRRTHSLLAQDTVVRGRSVMTTTEGLPSFDEIKAYQDLPVARHRQNYHAELFLFEHET